MIIDKVFNNNIVQVIGQNQLEYIVMGKGLGFQKKPGDFVDLDKIEKKFVLEDGETTQELYRVYLDLPTEQMELFLTIIKFAEAVLDQSFEPSLFIALADHLQFAIQRTKDNLPLHNPLAWEVRKFYPREYEIGKQALRLTQHYLGIEMAEDEAASIALHFVNAQKDGGLVEKNHQITQIVVDILEIVRLHFGVIPTTDSISYNRFVTHIQYFAQRVANGLIQGKNDAFLFEQVQVNYPKAFQCTSRVKNYVEQANPDFKMGQDEQVYLTIHIQRLNESHHS
ncbi:BglG family transcription antiterminator LicT [Streptococcus saliviloxodontae]|uniref:Beta-glucoside operon transcriptional antiterminator n=1 Tax=Streptococcus saliviloxodontae TaxID=1349416 RepID=A0ABS2PND2_9STRE|nr:PRD domain-containing protein [Streptococcus saliviloxodontae]MBM7636313.1 beta-glucoside operon transcriptional antiterminator [Streptococcus saliviloxodontae]